MLVKGQLAHTKERRRGLATFFVTGITGTVMGPLAALLLRRGHKVVALVRTKDSQSPHDRARKALSVASGVTLEEITRLFAVQGDVTEALGGITPHDLAQWTGKIDVIIHGAASIKLDNGNPEETFRTNVEGTKNILALARVLGAKEFCYVSTVFVAADARVFLETELRNGQRPRNPYEQSKIEAEELVRKSGMKFTNLRIPIVIGDSKTGKISGFSGYYGFFAPFIRLRQDLLKRRGKEADGTILLPLHIPCTEIGPLQIVCIDWIVKMMADLVEIPSQGNTYHLVHQDPPHVKEVIEWSLAHLGFSGMQIGEQTPQESQDRLWRSIQKGLLAGIGVFWPYTSLPEQRFGNEVLLSTLARTRRIYVPPPKITSELLGKLLDYAIAKDFGKT